MSEIQGRILQDRQRCFKEIHRGEIETLKNLKRDIPDFHWTKITCEKTGDTLLHVACDGGHLTTVKYLIEGFLPTVTEPRNYIGKTPLHFAAHNSHTDVTEYLLSQDVDIDALKRADWTPLMLACTKTSSEAKKTIKLLVNNGALVNYQNKDGWTALHLVCRGGSLEILEILMKHNLDLNKLTNNGRSALHISALHGNIDILSKVLNESKIDINLKDSCGSTPFHDAVLSGNINAISMLIDRNANANVTDGVGLGVLHLAAAKSTEAVVEYLINKLKVDLNAQSVLGLTPAHFAAKGQRRAVYELLVNSGANVNIKDMFNRTAYEYFE